MGKIGESLLFVVMGVAIIGLFMFFPSLRSTGNVVADYEYKANVGDALNYSINIGVPENGVDASTPIMISLSKDGKIIDSKIVNMGDFVKMSDNNITLSEGQLVPSGNYAVDISNIIKYNFDQKGEYELYFAVFKLDIVRTVKITVE